MEKRALTVRVAVFQGWRGDKEGLALTQCQPCVRQRASALLFNRHQSPGRQMLLWQFFQMRNGRLRLAQGRPVSRGWFWDSSGSPSDFHSLLSFHNMVFE